MLYRRHVAMLGIAEDVTAAELAVFFRCPHELRSGKSDDPPEEDLIREGICGIRRETAIGILREGRGTEFEPVFLDRFLEMLS